ncbi:MAG: LamG domain-containing protein [Victivallaceae bacterium]|nr:LamG domain-containing protein [Victivallaceae bacterium]
MRQIKAKITTVGVIFLSLIFILSLRVAAEDDLSFKLTFDNKNTTADFARGNPASTTCDANLEFRTILGFNLKNAFNKRETETLKYDVTKNIDYRQGTITIWLMAKNYVPKNYRAGNRSFKSFFYILFKNRNDFVKLYLYEYYQWANGLIYFECNGEKYAITKFPMGRFKQGEWFQVAVTWGSNGLKVYTNGKFVSKAAMPKKLKTVNFIPDPKESFIGLRERMWPAGKPDVGKETVIDDVKIYKVALSDLQVKNQYLKAIANTSKNSKEKMVSIDIKLNGIDDNSGSLDKLETIFAFNALSRAWRKTIKSGKAQAKYELLKPNGQKITGKFTPKRLTHRLVIPGITQPGKHKMTITLTATGQQAVIVDKVVVRPNTVWFKNRIGKAEKVPTPWTPLSIDADNVVRMWGREYHFGDGPLPTKVIHTGDSLLSAPPQLEIVTPQGKAKIRYKITARKITKTAITLIGTGIAKSFTINWKTRIEFDGFIRFDFAINGQPTITSMKLTWTVKPQFSKYLMTPLLTLVDKGSYETIFPTRHDDSSASMKNDSFLWMTSKKKGFCWGPEHDANWVYNKGEKVLRAVIDERGGHCEVKMITKSVKLPAGADYHAMFTTTPTRPLPKAFRTYRLGGYGQYSNCDVAMVQHVGQGTEGIYTAKPNKYFAQLMADFKRSNMKRLVMYDACTSLGDNVPESIYFGKYWNIPDGPLVPFPIRPYKKQPNEKMCVHAPSDPSMAYADYKLYNLKQLLTHPAERYAAIYYDLAINFISRNKYNGMLFKDKFGRTIPRYIIMGLREILKRSMVLAHSLNKDTLYHDHSYYNPLYDSFADYWYPGEQYTALMNKHKSPYVYSDIISDDIYKTELNSTMKGSAILFLGNLKRANRAYGTREQTEAYLTKLLLNDIQMSIAFEDGSVINKVWGIKLKYKLDTAAVILFDAKNNAVKSSNPQVKVTYYKCADGRYLLMIGNVSKQAQTATIDISKLKQPALVRDEYQDKNIVVKNDAFKVTIPARNFSIIGF